MTSRTLYAALLALAAAAVPLLVIGCGSTKAIPPIANGAYAGPPMGLDGSQENYLVVIHSPTPGWVATLDRVVDQYKHKAIFITLRKPNPAYFYGQVQVEQRVGTAVLSSESVKVYVRMLSFDQRAGDEPYTLAAQAQGTKRN
jgi:hypothetical protein